MRRVYTIFAAFAAVLGIQQPAHASFYWKQYGADPAFASRDAAMAARPEAFRALGLSNACIAASYAAMSVLGKVERLNPEDRLAAMMSSGFVVHRDVIVDFVPPAHGIENSAVVETWSFSCDGRTYKIGLPEVCDNWVLYYPVPQPIVPPSQAAGECSAGYSITLHVWSIRALPTDFQEEAIRLITAAASRNLDYHGPAFSRTLGYRLRTTPGIQHAPVNASIEVDLLDPATRSVVRRLGRMSVFAGIGTLQLPVDPRHYIVELLFPDWFVSPVPSNGVRRLDDLPDEWPSGECVQNMHAAVP